MNSLGAALAPVRPKIPTQLREAFLFRLEESGLDAKHAQRLGLEPSSAPPPEIALKGAGFSLPYFELNGHRNGFYRYRYLEPVKRRDKLVRYSQPAAAPPRAYFPPLMDWAEYCSRPPEEAPLLLTEGELKAASAAKAGIPCVGLGGVWNFRHNGALIKDLAQMAWQSRKAYIVVDSDGRDNWQVQQAADALAAELTERGATVYLLVLPELTPGQKTGLDDFLRTKDAEALWQKLLAAEEWQAARRILRSERLDRAVEKAERILATTREYKLFLRGSELMRVVEENRDYEPDAVFRRPKGNTYLAAMRADNVAFLLSKAGCVFNSLKQNGKTVTVPAEPKQVWCRQVISRIAGFPEQVPWHRLQMITSVPMLLSNGTLVDTPGYDETTGIWLDPGSHTFPSIPPEPTQEQARKALRKFGKVFSEFPFAVREGEARSLGSAGYAAVLATILSILIRHLLPTVPMLGISAPEAGSGKTKIAEAIAAATTGCLPSRLTYDNTEEFDKHLPVPLVAGDRIVLIDNVDRKVVHSARLSMVLTTEGACRFRVLGETREQVMLNRAVFIATGNQLAIAGDLPRRSLLVKLLPNVEQPEERRFDFDPPQRARELFPELVSAGLTAVRYYLQADCPQPEYATGAALAAGSFEDWNRIVRGCLVHLGYGDPLATQRAIRAENPMLQNDVELIHALRDLFPKEKEFCAADIRRNTGSPAWALLAEENGRWDPQKAGYRLRGLRDRILDGLTLEYTRQLHGLSLYRIKKQGWGGVG